MLDMFTFFGEEDQMDLRITIYCALSFAVIFGLFSFVFYFGDWYRLGFVAAFGLFFGICSAPEIEPKKFKQGWLLQIAAGFIAGLLVGVFFNLEIGLIFSCGIIGGFVGRLTPMWIRYV
jgi:hypothetical protein